MAQQHTAAESDSRNSSLWVISEELKMEPSLLTFKPTSKKNSRFFNLLLKNSNSKSNYCDCKQIQIRLISFVQVPLMSAALLVEQATER